MAKETRILMGMPVTVEVIANTDAKEAIDNVFDYFVYIDETFSTFKPESEVTKINNGLLLPADYSHDMQEVFLLYDKTKQETNGYFDIVNNQGKFDPSGLVKGWAIFKAAELLKKMGFVDFYVEAGGDIQVQGKNQEGKPWSIGIKNPFDKNQIVKTIYLNHNEGVATSGSYERGSHIYNPKNRKEELAEVVSLSVIAKNIYEADRFATAAFVLQKEGIHFIENLPGFEGYSIDKKGIATMTSGFGNYTNYSN